MRREEVVEFDYRVLPKPRSRDPDKQVQIVLDPNLTKTKGNKERFVVLPYDLAVAMYHYFTFEWPKLNAAHKRRHGQEATRLFLSRTGEPLSLTGLNNAFSKVSEERQGSSAILTCCVTPLAPTNCYAWVASRRRVRRCFGSGTAGA